MFKKQSNAFLIKLLKLVFKNNIISVTPSLQANLNAVK